MIVVMCITIVVAVALLVYLKYENMRRDRLHSGTAAVNRQFSEDEPKLSDTDSQGDLEILEKRDGMSTAPENKIVF